MRLFSEVFEKSVTITIVDTTIIFARKKNPTRKKKIFTITTELFEYKHKTTVINIEETHII